MIWIKAALEAVIELEEMCGEIMEVGHIYL